MDGKYEVIQQGGEPIIGFANGTPCTDYKDIVIFGDHTLSLYKPKQPFFVATDGVRILKGTKNVDGFFLLFLLERYKPQSEGYKRYFNILSDIECFMSYNISEQKKIGAFFDTLDNLITLHQRKQNDLFLLILGKKSSSILANDWEQRKLGSMVYRTNEMSDIDGLPRVEYEDIEAGQGTLNKDLKEKVSTKKGIVFQYGDILYGKLRPYLKNWLFAWFSGIAVGDFWVLRSNLVSHSFIYRLVQTPAFDYIANQSTGSKMPRADWNLVSNSEFTLPLSTEEQEAIGQIFS